MATPTLARRKRVVLLATLTSSLGMALALGYTGWRDAQAAEMLAQARERLNASLLEAPGLDRVQASTAISLIERAETLGLVNDEVRGLEHYARGLEDLQRGDLLLAEGELGGAVQFLGETADLHVFAAALSRGRLLLDDAQSELDAALAIDPHHPRALLLAADLALDRGEHDAARERLEALVADYPSSGPLHNRYGLALAACGDLVGAERELRHATELDRVGHDPWVNLGRLLRERGDHPEALVAFETAVARAPSDPDAIFGRGLERAANGQVEGAEQDFRRAAELAPNDAEPLLALGDLQRDLGMVTEAVETYRDAIDREDADAASWLKLGNALALLEDYEQAERAYRAALRRVDDLAAAHNGLGASLMHLGRTLEAQGELERAAAIDPSDPNPLMNLALMADANGDADARRAAWERVLRVWPESPIAARRLARIPG
jgi:tetratricopeptide (TPR) repeat protein